MESLLKDPLAVTLPDWFASSIIPLSAISGVVFALLLWYKVSQISVRGFSSRNGGREYLLDEEQGAESEVRFLGFRTSTRSAGPAPSGPRPVIAGDFRRR